MSLLSRLPRAIVWSLCGVGAVSPAADGPRIVRLASAPDHSATEPIREPLPGSYLQLSPANDQRPAEIQRRSGFVPVALPAAAPPIASAPVPEYSARPQFAPPQMAQRTLTQPPPNESLANAGPVLVSPTASPAPAWEQPALSTPQTPPPAIVPPVNAPPMAEPPTTTTPPTTTSAITSPPVESQRRSAFEPTSTTAPHSPPQSQAGNSPVMSAAMSAVVQRAMHKADLASSLAQRGMLYSARAELVQALQLIAHGLDAETASPTHATALSTGLTAIEEARDFATQASAPTNATQVRVIAEGHRTKAFGQSDAVPTSPVAAQQAYLGLAQSQFIAAAGQVPAASQVLYRLGRLETAMAAHDADPLALHAPQAVVFHQAALATDGGNWLAMNELGVLYARYGQLNSAKQLLLASVQAHPHVEGWQNLAAIHRRLGETDLAKRAESERQGLAARPGASAASSSTPIQWVDTKTFAASGGQDAKWPAEVAKKDAKK